MMCESYSHVYCRLSLVDSLPFSVVQNYAKLSHFNGRFKILTRQELEEQHSSFQIIENTLGDSLSPWPKSCS